MLKFLLALLVGLPAVAVDIELGVDGPANCHKGPDGVVVTSVPHQGRVVLLERKGDWYRVRYQRYNCWLSWRNLKLSDIPVPAKP